MSSVSFNWPLLKSTTALVHIAPLWGGGLLNQPNVRRPFLFRSRGILNV